VKAKRLLMSGLILMLLLAGTGLTFQPAKAAGCAYYHTVSYGQSLSWIGRYYGVNWKTLATNNGIKAPYRIYPGEQICVPGGGYTGGYGGYYTGYYYYPYNKGWSYTVTSVTKDTSVTIRTANMPDNVLFEVSIGRNKGSLTKVADLDSGKGGRFKATFNIPAQFAGASQLYIRLVQAKKGTTVDRWFSNYAYTSGTGGPYYPWYYYGGIPTIWINSVVRNNSVTISTNNFPAGLNFQVLMGPMGTAGVGGYYVTSFNSGAGGSMVLTFSIPPELYGSARIAIRTQNLATGYYSYNWFWN
jgi:hypothetical protein